MFTQKPSIGETNRIYYHIVEGTRESHSSVQDLQFTTRLAEWWMLQIIGSVPVDFLCPKFRVAHTKDDVISILMHKYTYTNMYIIKKIISCRFILYRDLTSLLKPYEKSCRRRKVKIEKILTVTYRTLLTKTTNFLKSGGYEICLFLNIISYST